jgi:hypothetical protein
MEGKVHMRRVVMVVTSVFLLYAAATSAQFAIHDAAVTARNTATAVVKEYLLQVQRDQHRQLRRMARRLSMHTNLGKYGLPDPPRWRSRRPEEFLFDGGYNAALIFGDPTGAAYLNLVQPLVEAADALDRITPSARRAFIARLATVNVADAAAIAGTHGTGQVRFIGRKRELPAINALEGDVIDPSNEQSATAVLEKISGAILIGARQRQARAQLLAGVLEQLLVDSKRARDTEALILNMQLVTWRNRQAANNAFAAGTGDALRTWRQP